MDDDMMTMHSRPLPRIPWEKFRPFSILSPDCGKLSWSKRPSFTADKDIFEESTDQTSLFDVNPSPWISKQPVAVKRKWLLPKQLTAKARRFCAPGYVIVS
jgi:hypothetical protein